jgi:DNA-binding transcriptional MerR regulator
MPDPEVIVQGEFFEVPRPSAPDPEGAAVEDIHFEAESALPIHGGQAGSSVNRRGLKDLTIPKLYYSISEVSRITGLEQYVLRYWETEFEELSPQKNRAGNRIYSNKDITFILRIKDLLREKRYTIEGAKQILKEEPAKEERPADRAASPERHAANAERAATGNVVISLADIQEMKKAVMNLQAIFKRGG